MPVVLYECETSSLALRKECRIRVFENTVLKGIFRPKGPSFHGSPASIQTPPPPAHCSVFCCSHLAILFLRMLVETSDTHSHSELANRPEDAGEE
jgi:hypothetical protein